MQSLAEIRAYRQKYRPKGILVDTCVMLLLLTGIFDEDEIGKARLTNSYSRIDFETAKTIISIFGKVIISPTVATELSNQVKNEYKGDKLSRFLEVAVSQMRNADEGHSTIKELLGSSELAVLPQLGFTDLSLYEIAVKEGVPLFTDDRRLNDFFQSRRVPSIKLTYLTLAAV
jgi:rRNA-processing protein FCF1